MPTAEALTGCLLGTALGDALGLPCEGLSPRRQQRLFPGLQRMQLFFGRGLCSDDTEHLTLTAQALIQAGPDPAVFQQLLARKLRYWLLGLPAGIGLATLRSLLRLWWGVSPDRSGVFSAGNGPAMRAALLGILYLEEPALLCQFIRVSTRLTHTDPRAEWGALAIALAAGLASRPGPVSASAYVAALDALLPAEAAEMRACLEDILAALAAGMPLEHYVSETLGCPQGVTGYSLHTVPAVLYAWFSGPDDFRQAVLALIRCGGDTDTSAALLGGILGARSGPAGLPQDWLEQLAEWPRSVAWLQALGQRLAESVQEPAARTPLFLPLPLLGLRNLFFLGVVLVHGFRRLLPPW